jgi:hypothetical protein
VVIYLLRLIGSKQARDQARAGLRAWILPFFFWYVWVHINNLKIIYFASVQALYMPPTCRQPNKHLHKVNAHGGPDQDHAGNQSEGMCTTGYNKSYSRHMKS